MTSEAVAADVSMGSEAEKIRMMIAKNSERAGAVMQQRIEANLEAQRAVMRDEIDALSFQSDRAMANELANRTLSKMFGSFTLIQKIIQNMG